MCPEEDLGLNLSLCFPQKNDDESSLLLNLNLCDKTFHLSDPSINKNKEGETTRSFLQDVNVNTSQSSAKDFKYDTLVASPNSTLSSISGKRSTRDGVSDEEDGNLSRKKLRLSKDHSNILEESFKEHNSLSHKQKTMLAKKLGLRPRQIEVWFQNRRARTKLKQTEVDCEFLKRCCDNLTEENRRLHKEVQELRAMKHSPHLYMKMTPAICPSCDGVASPSTTKPTAVIGQNVSTLQSRVVAIYPWATGLLAHRSFNALHPRS